MIEQITNTAFLQEIKTGIKGHGVFLMAVVTEVVDDVPFVYSVGHKESGRPDFFAFCVKASDYPDGGMFGLHKEMRATANLINYLVSGFSERPVAVGHTATDELGRKYVVKEAPTQYPGIRQHTTIQASNYYGSYDYELLVLELI